MLKAILYTVLCLGLFSVGLGLSIVVGKVQSAPPSVETNLADANLTDVVPGNPESEMILPDEIPKTELPVPVRGEPLTAEELFRFGAMYREQQDALKRREQDLVRRQSQLELTHNDILGSQKEFDGLRAQIHDAVVSADRLLSQVQLERENMMKQQENEEADTSSSPAADANASDSKQLRKVSAWVESMPPEKAAEYLRELSNDGRMNSAVELLGHLEERNAAKILAAMEDPVLIVELTEAFRNAKSDSTRVARQPRRFQ